MDDDKIEKPKDNNINNNTNNTNIKDSKDNNKSNNIIDNKKTDNNPK